MHRCALTFHHVTILRLGLAHSYSTLLNVCWTSLLLPFSLILLPSPPPTCLSIHSLHLNSLFLYVSIISFDCHFFFSSHFTPSLSFCPHPFVSSFITCSIPRSVLVSSTHLDLSYSYSPLPHFFIFHPFISLSFPTLSSFHLSSPSFSRSWIISRQIQCRLSRWHNHFKVLLVLTVNNITNYLFSASVSVLSYFNISVISFCLNKCLSVLSHLERFEAL